MLGLGLCRHRASVGVYETAIASDARTFYLTVHLPIASMEDLKTQRLIESQRISPYFGPAMS
jgi:hypothetical protein